MEMITSEEIVCITFAYALHTERENWITIFGRTMNRFCSEDPKNWMSPNLNLNGISWITWTIWASFGRLFNSSVNQGWGVCVLYETWRASTFGQFDLIRPNGSSNYILVTRGLPWRALFPWARSMGDWVDWKLIHSAIPSPNFVAAPIFLSFCFFSHSLDWQPQFSNFSFGRWTHRRMRCHYTAKLPTPIEFAVFDFVK